MISKNKKKNYNIQNLNQNIAPTQKKITSYCLNKSNEFISKNEKNKEMEIDSDLNESSKNSIIMNDDNEIKKIKIGNDSFNAFNNTDSYLENYSTANSNIENERKKKSNSFKIKMEYCEKPKISETNDSIEMSKEKDLELELDSNHVNEEEYMEEILDNFYTEEENNRFKINPNYFKLQTEINSKMRIILIDWLFEVNNKLKFREETFYTTIYIIDAYLSKKFIQRKKFQLLGVTALYIATKLNEIFSGSVKDYVFMTDRAYNESDIITMESDICKTLNFNFLVPNCLSFFQIFSKKIGLDKDSEEYQFGIFIIQNFLMNSKSFNYNYSIISIASCNLIVKLFEKDKNINFDLFYRDSLSFIEDCSKNICDAINETLNSNMNLSVKKYYYGKYSENIKKLISLYNYKCK
jgi:cyclin B